MRILNVKSSRCIHTLIVCHSLIPLGLFILIIILDYVVYSRKELAYFYCTPVILLFIAIWGPATKAALGDSNKFISKACFLGGGLLWLPLLVLGSLNYFEGGHSIGPILLTTSSSCLMFLLGFLYLLRAFSENDCRLQKKPEPCTAPATSPQSKGAVKPKEPPTKPEPNKDQDK